MAIWTVYGLIRAEGGTDHEGGPTKDTGNCANMGGIECRSHTIAFSIP